MQEGSGPAQQPAWREFPIVKIAVSLVPVGKDIELDAVGRQFELYPSQAVAPLWCHSDLGCCSW